MVTRSVGANDGLSSERHYTTKTLPRGVVRGLGDALRGDASGVGRAGAIIAGLATVTAGYAFGVLSGGDGPRGRREGRRNGPSQSGQRR